MGRSTTMMVYRKYFSLHESQSCHREGACILNEAMSYTIQATQDGWAIVESSENCGPWEEVMSTHSSILALRNSQKQ